MSFQITTLPRDRFEHLFRLGDESLAEMGARRYVADRKPGFPCRVTLQDAEPGERVILVPFQHQSAASLFQASGPIFVREAAVDVALAADAVPDLLRSRLLSVRAYDPHDLMIDADVVNGPDVEGAIERLFGDERAHYLHVHFARPGCYACRVDRV